MRSYLVGSYGCSSGEQDPLLRRSSLRGIQPSFPFQILFAPCISLADHRIQCIPHNVSPLPALSHSDLCFGSSVPNTAAQKLQDLLCTFILLNTVPIGGPCASIRSAVELRQGTIGPCANLIDFNVDGSRLQTLPNSCKCIRGLRSGIHSKR